MGTINVCHHVQNTFHKDVRLIGKNLWISAMLVMSLDHVIVKQLLSGVIVESSRFCKFGAHSVCNL